MEAQDSDRVCWRCGSEMKPLGDEQRPYLHLTPSPPGIRAYHCEKCGQLTYFDDRKAPTG